MANSSKRAAPPHVRRWLALFFAAPLLSVIAIYGYLFYARTHHLHTPQVVVSSTPFLTIPFGGVTARLFTSGDQLQAAGNDVFIEFRDAGNQPTNVGKVTFEMSLNMPGYVMHSMGKVHPTETPGRYRTMVEPQMRGDWAARIAFTNNQGSAETNFSLGVK